MIGNWFWCYEVINAVDPSRSHLKIPTTENCTPFSHLEEDLFMDTTDNTPVRSIDPFPRQQSVFSDGDEIIFSEHVAFVKRDSILNEYQDGDTTLKEVETETCPKRIKLGHQRSKKNLIVLPTPSSDAHSSKRESRNASTAVGAQNIFSIANMDDDDMDTNSVSDEVTDGSGNLLHGAYFCPDSVKCITTDLILLWTDDFLNSKLAMDAWSPETRSEISSLIAEFNPVEDCIDNEALFWAVVRAGVYTWQHVQERKSPRFRFSDAIAMYLILYNSYKTDNKEHSFEFGFMYPKGYKGVNGRKKPRFQNETWLGHTALIEDGLAIGTKSNHHGVGRLQLVLRRSSTTFFSGDLLSNSWESNKLHYVNSILEARQWVRGATRKITKLPTPWEKQFFQWITAELCLVVN
jgi:hypothetical protein